MQRISDREAVVNLAKVILNKGERTENQDSVLDLLFQMSQRDEVAKTAQREFRRSKKISQQIRTA